MAKIKILCTGSGGFLLSNFIRYTLKNHSDKYSIVSLDRCDSKKVLNTIYSNKGHNFNIGDITDDHIVDVIFELEKPDYVVHGAAKTSIKDSIESTNDFINTNVLGTQNIIKACIKHNVEKIIYLSTDKINVDNPSNPFVATKGAAELLIKAASNVHNLKYNIVRICNNFGPRQSKNKLIPMIITNVLKNEPVLIHDQGMQVRDWIHVQDSCSAVLKIIELGKDNETYNVSAKQEYTNIEVFQIICNMLEKGHDLIKFIPNEPGHNYNCTITNDKIKQLGWEPSFKFKNGLIHTISWYKNNSWFVK